MNEIENTRSFIDFIKHVSVRKESKFNTLNEMNKTSDIMQKPLEIMVFTGYSQTELFERVTKYTGSVKELNSNTQYNDVQILGIGLGNYKGIYMPLSPGDLVIVGWLNSQLPVILGSIHDYYSQSQDNTPVIGVNEILFSPKMNGGSVIYMRSDDLIKLKSHEKSEINIRESVQILRQDGTEIWVGDNIEIIHQSGNSIIITDTNISLFNHLGNTINISNSLISISNYLGGWIEIDNQGIRASNYKSSDGSLGVTGDIPVLDMFGFPLTLRYKNGLLTDVF